MSFYGIVVGDYGQLAKLTFIDIDTKAAADISSYDTTKQMIFTDPAGTETAKPATFETDGTDGIIKYTIEEELFDTVGTWKIRGRVKSGTAVLTTNNHEFHIGP